MSQLSQGAQKPHTSSHIMEKYSTTPHHHGEPRTHEENQERSLIAASHRGDRDLEARMESARKASDLHKKRTGRALNITEEDVLAEKMYDEIDDEGNVHNYDKEEGDDDASDDIRKEERGEKEANEVVREE
ncbi:hypothetical protein BKA69DRAFT_1092157 [Paraphysoderma sedebokerense]|nr:hypothetical protein BKA69DRAFT_1092105 [Paraphysoderma sedebokerense]KAI9138317.1 hypothetical protein BKA69DRAFT_1092157 [Paraphysoderma sedebokerense]